MVSLRAGAGGRVVGSMWIRCGFDTSRNREFINCMGFICRHQSERRHGPALCPLAPRRCRPITSNLSEHPWKATYGGGDCLCAYEDEATVDEEENDGEDQAPARLRAEHLSPQHKHIVSSSQQLSVKMLQCQSMQAGAVGRVNTC